MIFTEKKKKVSQAESNTMFSIIQMTQIIQGLKSVNDQIRKLWDIIQSKLFVSKHMPHTHTQSTLLTTGSPQSYS